MTLAHHRLKDHAYVVQGSKSHTHTHTHTQREREKEKEKEARGGQREGGGTKTHTRDRERCLIYTRSYRLSPWTLEREGEMFGLQWALEIISMDSK